MDKQTKQWAVLVLLIGILFVNYQKKPKTEPIAVRPSIRRSIPFTPQVETPKILDTPNISVKTPPYLDYSGIVQQLKTWNSEAPQLTETGIYGKSSKGKDLWFIRINIKNNVEKKCLLLHACLHGNEPHCTSVVMAYIGNMLANYGKDQEITELINTRDIYFVPVVCPDSYPNSRHIDGVDPNRDFPGPHAPNKKSTPCVDAIQQLFLKIKPNAVISGHTFGRVMLIPFGDKMELHPNNDDFVRIVGQMGNLCNYRVIRACQMYQSPIFGTEVDWYVRNSAFPIVMEFGTHQRIPTNQEIDSEFNRTFKGVLFFCKEAPLVKIKTNYIFKNYRWAA